MHIMSGTVKADSLFIGLTRPPLLFGVSYTFAILNAMCCLMSYVMTSNFLYLLALFPIHFLGYYFSLKEPLFIELFKIKGQKCSKSKNKFFHGANSYDVY